MLRPDRRFETGQRRSLNISRDQKRNMKLIPSILTAAFAILVPISASAQTAAGRQPATSAPRPAASATAPSTFVIPDGKIAIVDTEAFADPKAGITRLIRAFDAVNAEFKKTSDDLQRMRAQYEQLGKDIAATQDLEKQSARNAKIEQAEALKKDIERKAQDAQSAYQKKLRETTQPIYDDISPALQAFARERGVNVIFDVSKLGQVMFVVNDTVDLTRAFIADYNLRNPLGATPAKP